MSEYEKLDSKWIDEHLTYAYVRGGTEAFIHVEDLQNLLAPKQELPVIPKFVAEWLEDNRDETLWTALVGAEATNKYSDVYKFLWDERGDRKEKHNLVVRAWLDGYTVEKEHKYYARIKGWKNVTTGSEAFNWVYFKEKDTVGISKAVENKYQAVSFTKYDWNNLGINEDNADFIKVEELKQ